MAKKPIEVTSLKADTNPETWAEAPLYWATIEYHRFWLSVDRPRLTVLSEEDGQMTHVLLRDIAREYKVGRNLKGQDKKNNSEDETAQKICTILNSAMSSWPGPPRERIDACKKLIVRIRPHTAVASSSKKKDQGEGAGEKSKEKNKKTVDAASAVTKFIWFMKPEGWTVFDSYAAEGVGIPNYRAMERMEYFYKALILEKFHDLVENMQDFIRQNSVSMQELPATRILDTLFMARGARGSGSAHGVALTNAYLNHLPDSIRKELSDLATSLQEKYGQHSLVLPAPPEGRGKHWQHQREKEKKGKTA
jgi:hypothetical protein